ncbi:hypothetical protein ACP4OV_003705 [Aristida adscensionis]
MGARLLPACVRGAPPHVSSPPTCARPRRVPVARVRGAAARASARAPGRYISRRRRRRPTLASTRPHRFTHTPTPATAVSDASRIAAPQPMSDDQHSGDGGGGGQRQCRRPRGITADVELGAALALADMAGLGLGSAAQRAQPAAHGAAQEMTTTAKQEEEDDDDEEMVASTRLSLELGKVGFQSSSGSSSSSAAAAAAAAAATAPAGHGPSRPRHMLTEAEKEAKRLRRVLANRESARQTILRRQAIRDELARKVADLSSQNETMKKEKDMVMKEYLSLKETNRQLKAQQQEAHQGLSLSLF